MPLGEGQGEFRAMLLTEEEAKKKRCTIMAAVAVLLPPEKVHPFANSCIGSECAHWRERGATHHDPREHLGFCGLAGRPE